MGLRRRFEDMRMRTKLTVLAAAVLAAAVGLCALVYYEGFYSYSLEFLKENEREKLDMAQRALEQVGRKEEVERLGETAREAYLKYQFGRCYGQGYALLRGGECVLNQTDYELVNLGAMKGEAMVERLGRRRVLLMRCPLEYPQGYEVLAARDITRFWEAALEQAAAGAACFLGILAAACVLLALMARRLFRRLEELKEAAAAISGGELGRTVQAGGRDEVGQVAEAFNRMSRQVEQKVEELELLLGALAHEMKTPVTSIMGYSDSLLHVRLSEGQRRRALEQIYRSGASMERLAAKLMELIGLYENGAIVMERIKVRRLLEETGREAGEWLLQKGVTLEITCPDGIEVFGDRELLKSLLLNLLHNGCKASEPGGRVALRAGEGWIEVEDFGCGIPEKDLPHVKDAFYMADKSRSRSQGGHGLGLAVGERIARQHGASLSLESRPGEGTRAVVRFGGKALGSGGERR